MGHSREGEHLEYLGGGGGDRLRRGVSLGEGEFNHKGLREQAEDGPGASEALRPGPTF